MDVAGFIRALALSEGLPRDALHAASVQRSELAPSFIAEIERFLAAPAEAADAVRNGLFFMFHLLGDWRETAAYRPLARLLRLPDKNVDSIFGWATTETTHRVMAAVFDGDPQPLFDIVHDETVDEFIRSRMCETIAMATARGQVERETARRFLLNCFIDLRPQDTSYVWNGWHEAISHLGLRELAPLVEEAFKREFIDPSWTDVSYFYRDLEREKAEPGAWLSDREYSLFGDTIAELSRWYCFSDEYIEKKEKYRRERDWLSETLTTWDSLPHANPFKEVGRNDPCPCGSGKKYKKCCLRDAA